MAAIYGKSMADLEKFMLEHCKQLCEYATNEVYETINYFLNQYYIEWTPSHYQRTEEFLRSAFKTELKRVGNGYQAVVGIDYESLDNYKEATGFDVVVFANQGLHGGLDVDTNTHVWDDSIDSTIESGQLLADCIIFLKSRGLTVIG
jgi:hypothetical protein